MDYFKIMLFFVFIGFSYQAEAQKKTRSHARKDSLQLKADLEAIRHGRPIKPQKSDTASVLKKRRPIPARIDSNTMKPTPPSPTSPSPNNPNPHDPRPSPMNPSLPATPPENPAVPPGSPRGPGSAGKE